MQKLTVSEKTLNKYFGILENLDSNSKQKLIIKLTRSISKKPRKFNNLKNIFGAWQGSESAEEIISDIRDSRYDYRKIEEL